MSITLFSDITLSAFIKAYKSKTGATDTDLHQMTGVSVSTLRRIINETVTPTSVNKKLIFETLSESFIKKKSIDQLHLAFFRYTLFDAQSDFQRVEMAKMLLSVFESLENSALREDKKIIYHWFRGHLFSDLAKYASLGVFEKTEKLKRAETEYQEALKCINGLVLTCKEKQVQKELLAKKMRLNVIHASFNSFPKPRRFSDSRVKTMLQNNRALDLCYDILKTSENNVGAIYNALIMASILEDKKAVRELFRHLVAVDAQYGIKDYRDSDGDSIWTDPDLTWARDKDLFELSNVQIDQFTGETA